MKKIFFILFLVGFYQFSFSQTEKTETITEDCETAAARYAKLLSKYSIEQAGPILEILKIWEAACGENEPIIRVKILLDIANNSFVDSTHANYFTEYIFNYFDRIEAAYQEDYNEIYKNDKTYFNYVPLRSAFDDWTYQIAKSLRENQKEGTSAYLITILLSEDMKTFDEELKSDKYKDAYIKKTLDEEVYNSTKDDVGIVFNSGVWVPIGELRRKFGISPVVGLGANIQISKKYSLEIGAQFAFWLNNKEIDVNVIDSVESIKSKYGGTYGFWIHRSFSFENDYFFDATGGLAYTNMGTGIERIDTEEDGTSYYHISTFDISLGFNIRKRIRLRNDIGFAFAYHFRPYNIDKRLVSKLGKHSYTLNLFYKF